MVSRRKGIGPGSSGQLVVPRPEPGEDMPETAQSLGRLNTMQRQINELNVEIAQLKWSLAALRQETRHAIAGLKRRKT
jgi:hypothetical protein